MRGENILLFEGVEEFCNLASRRACIDRRNMQGGCKGWARESPSGGLMSKTTSVVDGSTLLKGKIRGVFGEDSNPALEAITMMLEERTGDKRAVPAIFYNLRWAIGTGQMVLCEDNDIQILETQGAFNTIPLHLGPPIDIDSENL